MNDTDRALMAAAACGLDVCGIEPIVGDASRRTFYRLTGSEGSIVAAVYPPGAEDQLARDERVHSWGFARGLPIPRPLGHTELVAFSVDLGDEDLERALRSRGENVLEDALETLSAFQSCGLEGLANPPFGADFFRRELEVFEQFAIGPPEQRDAGISGFLDDLAGRLAGHPFRLVHRDFHANNLFVHLGAVWAVDYQDMRGGPDTYDAASLLRERAGGEMVGNDARWRELAAARLSWAPGWQRRYLECAAQRGLKVTGTFLRLASAGRAGYLAWLPRVLALSRDALVELGAPAALVDVLARVPAGL